MFNKTKELTFKHTVQIHLNNGNELLVQFNMSAHPYVLFEKNFIEIKDYYLNTNSIQKWKVIKTEEIYT